MGAAEPDPVTVRLPRPVDRRLRLGPFPSARDALKFAGYASVGLVAVPLAGPLALAPFALAGFLIAMYRRDGRPLDDHVVGYVAWRWRHRFPGRRAEATGSVGDGAVARAGRGRMVAILRAGGVPVAFLPPGDARALFESTRRWLDGLDGGAYIALDAEPIRPDRYRPSAPAHTEAEATAREGYDEVVRLLLRRRRSRRVAIVLWETPEPAGVGRLEDRARFTAEALRSLGVATERLSGARLRAELRRLSLGTGGTA